MKKIGLSPIAALLLAPSLGAEPQPDFGKDIKPLFETRCIKCHGPSKMEGELDLSYREAAEIGGEYGPAIIGGDAENSVLMQRITMDKEEDEVMPPKGTLLTKKQIALIRSWIEAGAEWPEELVLKEVKDAKGEDDTTEGATEQPTADKADTDLAGRS